jgi:threonine aldolase
MSCRPEGRQLVRVQECGHHQRPIALSSGESATRRHVEDENQEDQRTVIDLSSDTATKPTPEMRRFMAEAPVGDEQRREDPSVNELQTIVAELTGKEAALFLPSGTMCNAIAFCLHPERGDAVILHRDAHPYTAERGGPAWLANVIMRPVAGTRGIFTADEIRPYIEAGDTHIARTSMISVENTTNRGGGKPWPLDTLAGIRALADEHRMKVHMDGARLMNAVVTTSTPAATYASYADSVWIDLSKGLGAPVGAVLAGSTEFIERARLLKHMLGGAMRQAGIIAAAGVYAFRHHVERMSEDHANAKLLAEGLASIPGIRLMYDEIETNIVFFDTTGTGKTSDELERAIEARGVRMGGYGGKTIIRAVTHLDISRADVEQAVAVVRAVCG